MDIISILVYGFAVIGVVSAGRSGYRVLKQYFAPPPAPEKWFVIIDVSDNEFDLIVKARIVEETERTYLLEFVPEDSGIGEEGWMMRVLKTDKDLLEVWDKPPSFVASFVPSSAVPRNLRPLFSHSDNLPARKKKGKK